jgi:hypothetical protein
MSLNNQIVQQELISATVTARYAQWIHGPKFMTDDGFG